ncbi:hypothetical protein BBO99_00002879 [Phytophthora kernoviae]|uniref:USP domain-containing protein n=1 Tax=Phytophthora kernoviae TaxID=325452 RepID=A0A3R7FZP1_9STRA|nr:hypothetical protein BBI17_002794 [Phytophthora kernoviae]RLN82467.1 hypothetical protein BBO99_00002879 [Phytophthora kernoviae]
MEEEELELFQEVQEDLRLKSTVGWQNAVKVLNSAFSHFDRPESQAFLDDAFSKIISIMLDQHASKIGSYEKSCVTQCLSLAVPLVITQLKGGKYFQALPVLVMLFSKKKTFYKDLRTSAMIGSYWNKVPGSPEVRAQCIEAFCELKGFHLLLSTLELLMQNHHDGDELEAAMDSEDIRILLQALLEFRTLVPESICTKVCVLVMTYFTKISDSVLKKESSDAVGAVIAIIRRLVDAGIVSSESINALWLDITERYVESTSLPLRLFGLEQINQIVNCARASRAFPPRYFVRNAGTDVVNGVYNLKANSTSATYVLRREETDQMFTLFCCTMKSGLKWWFISEADKMQPGSDQDIDYYQHQSQYEEYLPPTHNWMPTGKGEAPAPELIAENVKENGDEDQTRLDYILSAWVVEKQIIEEIFGDRIHREIVSRSALLVKFLAESNKLDTRSIDVIWKSCIQKDQTLVHEIHNLLIATTSMRSHQPVGAAPGMGVVGGSISSAFNLDQKLSQRIDESAEANSLTQLGMDALWRIAFEAPLDVSEMATRELLRVYERSSDELIHEKDSESDASVKDFLARVFKQLSEVRDSSPDSLKLAIYTLQIMDALLLPSDAEKVLFAQTYLQRFISGGGFHEVLSYFITANFHESSFNEGAAVALRILKFCLFDSGHGNGLYSATSNGDAPNEVLVGSNSSADATLETPKAKIIVEQNRYDQLVLKIAELVVSEYARIEEKTPSKKKAYRILIDAVKTVESVVSIAHDAATKYIKALEPRAIIVDIFMKFESEQVREQWLASLESVCKASDTATEVVFEECIQSINRIESVVASCDQYTRMLCSLARLENGKSSEYCRKLALAVVAKLRRGFSSKFLACNERSGDVLIGFLEFLREVLVVHADVRAGIARDIVDVVYEECLFTLPSEDRRRCPLCVSLETRRPAFKLLASAISSDASILHDLQSRLSRLFTRSDALRLKWGQENNIETRGNGEHVGLKNQGCSCYMNSFLQQLFMHPTLRQGLLGAKVEPRSTPQEPTKLEAEKFPDRLISCRVALECLGGRVYEANVVGYDDLTGRHTLRYDDGGEASFVLAEGRPGNENGRYVILQPELTGIDATLEVLRQLQRTFCYLRDSEMRYFNPKAFVDSCTCLNLEFSVYQQNDATEFCDKLLDRLETGLKTTPQGTRCLQDVLGGKLISQKLPKDCGHRYEREEPFIRLELQIRGKESIEESLTAFVEGELMDGDNKVECELCETKKAAVRRTCFGSLPNLLRCDYESEVWKSNEVFLQNSYLFDVEFHEFLREMVQSQYIKDISLESTVDTIPMALPPPKETIDASAPPAPPVALAVSTLRADEEIQMTLTEIGVEFVLGVLLHSREKHGIARWITVLASKFTKSKGICVRFFTALSTSKCIPWLRGLLFECPDSIARQSFVHLVSRALTAYEAHQKEEQGALAKESAEAAAAADTIVIRGFLEAIASFLDQTSIMQQSHLEECFMLLRNCAEISATARSQLQQLEMIARLINFFLCDRAPSVLKDAFPSSTLQPTASRYASPDYQYLLEAIIAILGLPRRTTEPLLTESSTQYPHRVILSDRAEHALTEIFEEYRAPGSADSQPGLGIEELKRFLCVSLSSATNSPVVEQQARGMLAKYGTPNVDTVEEESGATASRRRYVVEGAGYSPVNGVYISTSHAHDNCLTYACVKPDIEYTLFRCCMPSKARRWYISYSPNKSLLGTMSDEDFYFVQSHVDDESPPVDGWKVWVKNEKAKPPVPTVRLYSSTVAALDGEGDAADASDCDVGYIARGGFAEHVDGAGAGAPTAPSADMIVETVDVDADTETVEYDDSEDEIRDSNERFRAVHLSQEDGSGTDDFM